MKIGYQGIPGAYSHIAANYLFPKAKHTGFTSFDEVFESLETKAINNAILPIENTVIGSINEVYDLIFKYKYYIKGEVTLKIDHNLLSLSDSQIKNIDKVYSHPKALGQCRDFFEKHPNMEPIDYEDTAVSAGYVSIKKDPTLAAIASLSAAKIYNLEVIEPKIQTGDQNYTRFVIVDKNNGEITGDKTSLLFAAAHKPGSLLSCLKVFSEYNLTYIESRPLINQAWNYLFYLDFEHKKGQDIDSLIKKVKPHTQFVRRLGTYPKGDFIAEKIKNNTVDISKLSD